MSQIPLFVLMGYFAFYSGSSTELYGAMYKFLGRLPGGLAVATIGASAAFASISVPARPPQPPLGPWQYRR